MKIIRFLFKTFVSAFLIFLILWVVFLGILQTDSGQQWAFKKFTDYFERKTQKEIEITKMTFSFPLDLHLEGVTISQDHHPLIKVKEFSISLAYAKLLQGRMVFSKVQANDVDLFEIPSPSEPSTNHETVSWDAPPLPVYVKIENLDIQNLKLSPQIIETLKLTPEINAMIHQSSLNLSGNIKNNPFRSTLDAHLLMTIKSQTRDYSYLSLGLDTQNQQLSLSLHLNQFSLQMADSRLPKGLKADLALFAAAPVSTWQKLAQQTPDEFLIDGHFKLILNSDQKNQTPLSILLDKQAVARGHYSLKSNQSIEFTDLKIENPNFAVVGKATLKADQSIEQGEFKGELRQLEQFKDALGKEIKGKINFDLEASGPLASPEWNLQINSSQLTLAEHSLQNFHSTIKSIAQNQSSASLTVKFDHKNIPWNASTLLDWNNPTFLSLSQLEIHALQSQLKGNLNYFLTESIWEGLVDVQMNNFSPLNPFLPAPIKGKGLMRLKFANLQDSDQKIKQDIQADLQTESLEWMDGQTNQMIFHLHLTPTQDSNIFHVQTLLEANDIQWKNIFIHNGMGNSKFTFDASQNLIRDFSSDWQAKNIEWPEGKVAQASGQMMMQAPLHSLEGKLDFALRQIRTHSFELEELNGSTQIPNQKLKSAFTLSGKGFWKEDLLFALEGSWQNQNEGLEIHVQNMQGRFGPYPFQIKQPLQFIQGNQSTRLTKLWLQWGEAEIQADFKQDLQNIAGSFKTNAVPSELFRFITPDLSFTGKAIIEGKLEGSLQHPKGQFQIDLQNVQVIEEIFAKKPLINGRMFLNLDEKGIQVKSDLKGIGQTPLLISGHFPISLSLNPFDLQTNPQLSFELSLNAEGELDPYLHLFYNDTTNLSGQAKIALKLSGQMTAPQIQGRIDLVNGSFESLSTGTLYHHIQAHLEGNGSKITLTQLSAQDNKNGRISATGSVKIDPAQHFPFEFKIQPSHIFILDSDYVDISASGNLTLIGNTHQSKLQGELTIDQANVDLDGTLPQQIKKVDIHYINASENDLLTNHVEKPKSNSNIELDVKLNAAHNVTIKGKNLKSQWKGMLAVNGGLDNPQLHGDLRISEGQFDFNGKIFQLSQGNIHFAGPVGKKTSLYIVASKELDRITAEVIVKGPVTNPVVSFRSNPPLSQREVLSNILFNRGISDITPDQGEQLSQSFISLNSSTQTKSSTDFLTRLRNNTGIDRLDFTTGDNPDNKTFGLQVGKNITENIAVSVNQNMNSLAPVIAIEAKLRKNLKAQLQAGMGEEAPVRMSIKWKKDY